MSQIILRNIFYMMVDSKNDLNVRFEFGIQGITDSIYREELDNNNIR